MSRMPPSLNRRSLLKGIGGLGLAGSATALTLGAEEIEGLSPNTVDEPIDGTAESWARRAIWPGSGMSTEFPLQVMYPAETVKSLEALDAQDSLDRVEIETAANNATRLQGADKGGFYSAAGDALGPWTRSTYGAVVLSNQTGADIDRDAATRFLKNMQKQNGGFAPRYDWFGIAPLGATMEATDHALWALQHLNELDESTRQNAHSFLQNKQTPQGGWPLIGEMVEPSTTGTYHALRALDALDADSKRNREKAAEYLKSLQADGGGFYAGDSPISCKPGCVDEPRTGVVPYTGGKHPESESSGQQNCNRQKDADPWTCDTQQQRVTTYSTSRAILALERTGFLDSVEDLQQHADWLASQQVSDPADPRYAGAFHIGYDTFYLPRNTTRLALKALAVLENHGVTPNGEFDLNAAVDFLVDCQYPWTGGFGGWPNYVQMMVSTEAAMKALSDLGAEMPAEELAETLASTQQRAAEHPAMSAGAIPPQGWKYSVDTDQTAAALLALTHAGTYGDVDVDAAASWIEDRQVAGSGFRLYSDSGGALSTSSSQANLYATNMAVLALDAVDQLGRVDLDGLKSFYATVQNDELGYFGRSGLGYQGIATTSMSLRAIAAAGIGNAEGIDVDKAAGYLADLPAEDGEYWPDPSKAGQAVLGLDAVDELDRVDTDATQEYIEVNQMSSGGFVGRGFYAGFTAMHRHAAAISALSILGGSPENADGTDATGFEPSPSVDEAYGIPVNYHGRGVVNHRRMLADPDQLAE